MLALQHARVDIMDAQVLRIEALDDGGKERKLVL